MPDPQLTLMTVHAHPDDETIGTGGTMARAVDDGRRVVLITCTHGELGEIVVPELATPDNVRRLGSIRAGELELAMRELGVTEWDNLDYRDSGMMGEPTNRDPRCFWQADLDEAVGRLVWFVRRARPHVMTTYNPFGGYGHPDHIRSHDVAVAAFDRAGDAAWYPEQLAPDHGGSGPAEADGGLAPWAPLKLYEQAIPASVRAEMTRRLESAGVRTFMSAPIDATPEELAAHEDVGPVLQRKWAALHRHVTQFGPESSFVLMGLEGWRESWSREAYVLRESRVETSLPETDLFAGIAGA
jgi:N-acetyl-1-D-myo-inositol-2-amino-2-deoxy-alpha-D-glucopyranoside deacetylase